MSRFIRLFTALVVLAMLSPVLSAAPPTKDAATQTAAARFAAYGQTGTFLLKPDGQREQVAHGAAFADTPLRPASTFKPMLALIALETGVLKSADEIVPWNGKPYPDRPAWRRDMALREAMQTSSESYFGVLAERIGRERLAAWVQRVGYGNGRIGPTPALVWHDGVFTVTARQQLAFVDRLRRGDLPFSAKTIAMVKAAMRDDANGARIYGKTGTHSDDGTGTAWWIGWVEGPRGNASFALAIDLTSMDDRAMRVALGKRIALGKQLLRDAGALPK
ncbi:MAG: penicillin-binding transpeptidase domain-containing protein [Pseudomonadota bacterium]